MKGFYVVGISNIISSFIMAVGSGGGIRLLQGTNFDIFETEAESFGLKVDSTVELHKFSVGMLAHKKSSSPTGL